MHSRWEESDDFADLLAAIIARTGLSQRELADLAGVSHSQVSRWKAGEHQPGYAPMMRLGAGLLNAFPDMGDLTPILVERAGYRPALSTEERRITENFAAMVRAARDKREGNGDQAGTG